MNTTASIRTTLTALALALGAGCMETESAPEEPTADESRARDVAASADTTAALGITHWHFAPHEEGLVVRGLTETDEPAARFWIEPGETEDELVAHATESGAEVTITRDGTVRGDDATLRDWATSFRTDVEASWPSPKSDPTQNVNDNVTFCPGSVGTFGTWAFWRQTTIAIDNPFQDKWLKFSFQAGAGYEEQWVPPAPYSSVPWFFYWRTYPRAYWGVPVTIRYLDSWPDGGYGPCRQVRVY